MKDHQRFVVRVTGPRHAGSYWFYDRTAAKLQPLGAIYAKLSQMQLAPMEIVNLTARDGLALTAYLTRPANTAGKRPLIVMPHGGPELRDTYDYDQLVQVMAAEGWMVLQVNFRGSSGYGRAFVEAGNKRWGDLMQNDIEDALKKVVERGDVDESRLAICGMSYGGYAAPATRTSRVRPYPDRPRLRRQGVVDQQAAGQALPRAGDRLDCLQGHHRADHARQGPDHPDQGAGLGVGRDLGDQAAVTGLALEHAHLAGPAAKGAADQCLALGQASVTDGEARREVVGAVQHQVIPRYDRPGVGLIQPYRMGFDGQMRVQRRQMLRRRFDLGPAGVGGGKQHLALQVGQRDGVGVDQAQGPDPGGGQVEGGRRAQPPGPDHKNPCCLQLLLARSADLAQHQMAGVSLDLGVGKAHPA
jgi:dienelactone hydrolase